MANVFFDKVLQPLQATLSGNLKRIPIMLGNFRGNQSVRLVPVSQEQIRKSTASVDYEYNVFIEFKTNKTLDVREKTQEAHNIKTILDQNPDVSIGGALKF